MRSLLHMNMESTIHLILSNPYPSPDEVIMAPTHLMRLLHPPTHLMLLLRLNTVSTFPFILFPLQPYEFTPPPHSPNEVVTPTGHGVHCPTHPLRRGLTDIDRGLVFGQTGQHSGEELHQTDHQGIVRQLVTTPRGAGAPC